MEDNGYEVGSSGKYNHGYDSDRCADSVERGATVWGQHSLDSVRESCDPGCRDGETWSRSRDVRMCGG